MTTLRQPCCPLTEWGFRLDLTKLPVTETPERQYCLSMVWGVQFDVETSHDGRLGCPMATSSSLSFVLQSNHRPSTYTFVGRGVTYLGQVPTQADLFFYLGQSFLGRLVQACPQYSPCLCEGVAGRRPATPAHKHGLCPPFGFQQAFMWSKHRRQKAGDAPHEGLLKVERREFSV